MTVRLPIVRLLQAAACVCLVLAASPLAHSQDVATAAPKKHDAPLTQKLILETGDILIWHTPRLSNEGSFRHFFEDVNKETADSARDYSEEMRIGKDQEKTMRSISLDALHRIVEVDKQINEAWQEYGQKHEHQWVGWPYPPEIQAVGQKYNPIFEETFAKLKQELGDESFKKMDYWIYQHEQGGRIMLPHDRDGNFIHDHNGRLIAVPAPVSQQQGDSASAQSLPVNQ